MTQRPTYSFAPGNDSDFAWELANNNENKSKNMAPLYGTRSGTGTRCTFQPLESAPLARAPPQVTRGNNVH
eukprot:CAMPEP_0117545198 /NCGR_PEP_ID=MMETSP0784-20121206/45971_1 /TAXON_ID=39447 /ORGANISM="" /LENGTH=70 /DNA_ID=CAMNT_0005342037 /DNA_START=39 /DNA_END=249 /DNA_ORIENTATION=-